MENNNFFNANNRSPDWDVFQAQAQPGMTATATPVVAQPYPPAAHEADRTRGPNRYGYGGFTAQRNAAMTALAASNMPHQASQNSQMPGALHVYQQPPVPAGVLQQPQIPLQQYGMPQPAFSDSVRRNVRRLEAQRNNAGLGSAHRPTMQHPQQYLDDPHAPYNSAGPGLTQGPNIQDFRAGEALRGLNLNGFQTRSSTNNITLYRDCHFNYYYYLHDGTLRFLGNGPPGPPHDPGAPHVSCHLAEPQTPSSFSRHSKTRFDDGDVSSTSGRKETSPATPSASRKKFVWAHHDYKPYAEKDAADRQAKADKKVKKTCVKAGSPSLPPQSVTSPVASKSTPVAQPSTPTCGDNRSFYNTPGSLPCQPMTTRESTGTASRKRKDSFLEGPDTPSKVPRLHERTPDRSAAAQQQHKTTPPLNVADAVRKALAASEARTPENTTVPTRVTPLASMINELWSAAPKTSTPAAMVPSSIPAEAKSDEAQPAEGVPTHTGYYLWDEKSSTHADAGSIGTIQMPTFQAPTRTGCSMWDEMKMAEALTQFNEEHQMAQELAKDPLVLIVQGPVTQYENQKACLEGVKELMRRHGYVDLDG